MISEKLQKAREFEQEQLSKISPEERPSFHVTGGTGWINDPNGFSYYNGEYHLFYQYHPYSNEWGLDALGTSQQQRYACMEKASGSYGTGRIL